MMLTARLVLVLAVTKLWAIGSGASLNLGRGVDFALLVTMLLNNKESLTN